MSNRRLRGQYAVRAFLAALGLFAVPHAARAQICPGPGALGTLCTGLLNASSCTISGTAKTLTNNCTVDFGGRAVLITTTVNAQVTAGVGGNFTLLGAASMDLNAGQLRSIGSGSGTGGAISVTVTGFFRMRGSSPRVNVNGDGGGGSISISAGTIDIQTGNPALSADGATATGLGGSMTLASSGSVTVNGRVSAAGGGQRAGGSVTISGSSVTVSKEIDVHGGGLDGGTISLTSTVGNVTVQSTGSLNGNGGSYTDALNVLHVGRGGSVTLTADDDVAIQGAVNLQGAAGSQTAVGGRGGDLTATANTGQVSISAAVQMNGGNSGGSGGTALLTAATAFTLAATGSFTGVGKGGGTGAFLTINAGGNGQLLGPINLTSGGGGSGGRLTMTAATVNVQGTIDAFSGGADSGGGIVNATATTGSVTVGAAIDVTASGTDSSAGTIKLLAAGDVDVLAALRAFDLTSEGSTGGAITVDGGGNVSIGAAVDARASGTDSSGDDVSLSAGGDLSITADVSASAFGTDAAGGFVELIAGDQILTTSTITVSSSDDGGDIEYDAPSVHIQTGSSWTATGGSTDEGTVTPGRFVTFPGTFTVDGSIDTSSGLGTAAEIDIEEHCIIIINGSLDATGGDITLSGGTVTIAPGATITPNADIVEPGPTPCCGNGVINPNEQCDDGNTAFCDGCTRGCQTEPAQPCDDGNVCTTDSCSATTGCAHTPITCPSDGVACTVESCTPGVGCQSTPNNSLCNDGNTCTSDICTASGCTASTLPNGTACNDGNVCSTDDQCANGTCVPSGPALDCDDEDPCSVDSCNAGFGCQHVENTTLCPCSVGGTPLPAGTHCANGDWCTAGDQCDGSGSCVAGAARTCDDGDACTWDLCSNACFHIDALCTTSCAGQPDGTPCTDNTACTTAVCSSGTCQPTPIACEDGNICNGDSICVPVFVGCADRVPPPDGTACDDDDACTQTDTCQDESCAGDPVVCTASDQCHDAGVCNPQTGVCSDPAKPNGTACTDANACTQSDTCEGGVCTGANPVVCTPIDQCHNAGTCNPASGVCSDPAKPDGSSCTDGLFCNGADSCTGGSCLGHGGDPCPGADGDGNCSESCDETADACTAADPNGSACTDGSMCTQVDACQGGSCAGGSPVTCSASDQCHDAGVCNPATGTCSNPPKANGTSCNDNDACTATDTCQSGVCTGSGDLCTGDLTLVRTIAPPNANDSFFGISLAAVGDDLAIGASSEMVNGVKAGAGYLVEPSTRTLLAQYVAPNPGNDDLLGFFNAMAALGTDRVLIGAAQSDLGATNAGAAFVFDAATGSVLQTLQVSPITNRFYGLALSTIGGDAVVAEFAGNPLRAYRQDVVTGAILATYESPFCATEAPISIAAAGNTVAVGLPQVHDACTPPSTLLGSRVCLFDATSGALLFPCLADAEKGLGWDLTGRGTNFLVTKFAFESPGGLAQLIDGSTGTALQTYVTTDPPNSAFGTSATPLGADLVAVGGFETTTQRGFVEVFDASTAELIQRIANPFAKTLLFGVATTSIGDSLVVSALAPGGSGAVGVIGIYAPCGHGTVDAGETCDDGNQNDGDGCSATCQVVPALCGNGVIDAGEACDDGNTAPLDCCAENCQLEPAGTPCGDDSNICTNDVCNAAGACTHSHNTAPCEDGDACTLSDRCDAGTCVPGSTQTCDDGNACTDDSCNPATGCVFTNNTAPCNDGVLCTANDACSGGSCQGQCVVGAACGPNCSPSQTCQLVGGVCGCQ